MTLFPTEEKEAAARDNAQPLWTDRQNYLAGFSECERKVLEMAKGDFSLVETKRAAEEEFELMEEDTSELKIGYRLGAKWMHAKLIARLKAAESEIARLKGGK